jgi:hypothetical protein
MIKDMVINNRYDVKNVRDDFNITRDHKRLLTVHQDKDYRLVTESVSAYKARGSNCSK